MDDLIAFMNARLDEEEAAATAMIAAFEGVAEWVISENGEFDYTVTAGLFTTEAVADTWREDAAGWITRHDPARALREVTAKRATLARWREANASRYECAECEAPAWLMDAVVTDLAAAWSDHPGYLQRWAPPA